MNETPPTPLATVPDATPTLPTKPRPKALTAARLEQVLELLVCGLNRREIQKWTKEKGKWEVSDRTIDRLIVLARDTIMDGMERDRSKHIALAVRRLDVLFARCMQITDYKGALAVENSRIALLGLSKRK
jgi:hypothetical protein